MKESVCPLLMLSWKQQKIPQFVDTSGQDWAVTGSEPLQKPLKEQYINDEEIVNCPVETPGVRKSFPINQRISHPKLLDSTRFFL